MSGPGQAGHIVTFGEVLLRFATPGYRLTVQSDALDMAVGGAEANVAAGLSSLGHDVKMLTLLPSSPLGDKARAALNAAGIDTTHVSRASGRMGLYFLESGAGLRPSSITYDRAGSVFALSSKGDFDFASALEGARLLHLSGITPALGPGGVALAQAAVAEAISAGVPICFDGNYRALLWDAWDSDPRAILTELMQSATVMIGNHRDISLLLGRPFSGDGADRRREAALAAFEAFPKLQLIASTARHIVNAGHHRIAARIDARASAHQAAEVDVTGIVDRIGTGDAFAAGVLHRWLEGADIVAIAQAGLACTVLKHTIPGDMCLVSLQELEAFSASGGDVRR
ncbi:sugar kinase [Novosphingobium sp. Leaf2]|uniref:sugar kinase n=1 Tax=Novosphingobium sp. Leaf2 TaxID=1735670 RepID=UPI0006F39BE9|nr:sugar kinase [Novosphingobium sp. Leaf2]KQM20379.1 2-keto-3-deoxygluconate kinase [Novosphingobium sp. Leaf2]